MFPGLAIDGQTVVWTHRRPENITPHLPVWLDLRTQRLIFQSGLTWEHNASSSTLARPENTTPHLPVWLGAGVKK